MFHVLGSILPIFSIILLGYFLRVREVIGAEYARTANQIVFYVAIPAMLFGEIAETPFSGNFHGGAVLCVLTALGAQVFLGMGMANLLSVPRSKRGTFLQSSFHGNLGYMAYAMAYYVLGKEDFARVAILSGFLMIGQNVLAVWALAAFSAASPVGVERRSRWVLVRRIFDNPIILTVLAGMAYSALGLSLPDPVRRGLDILAGMALPTALLLIGAGLSFGTFRTMAPEVIGAGVLKLVCMPFVGYALLRLLNVPDLFTLPVIILLAAPPATVAYVMAAELGGDTELAAAAISILTLSSALTYSIFLSIFAA